MPAPYDTLTSTMKVAEAREEWRFILWETNATPAKIKEIQQSLAAAGYNPGPVDGVTCAQSMSGQQLPGGQRSAV